MKPVQTEVRKIFLTMPSLGGLAHSEQAPDAERARMLVGGECVLVSASFPTSVFDPHRSRNHPQNQSGAAAPYPVAGDASDSDDGSMPAIDMFNIEDDY